MKRSLAILLITILTGIGFAPSADAAMHHRHHYKWVPGHYVWRHHHKHWVRGHYARIW